jgi:hypothetical protein
MELPADVEYVEDANLFIWRPRGVLSEALGNESKYPYVRDY